MTDSTGTTVRTYDEMNRVVTKYVTNFGSTIFTYDIVDAAKGVDAGQVGEESKDPKCRRYGYKVPV